MKKCFAALFMIAGLFVAAGAVGAQELTLPRVDVNALAVLPGAVQAGGMLVAPSQTRKNDVVDKKLTTLAAVLYLSMIADTRSTFDSKAWCPRCVETNPYAAPFVNRGPVAAYAAGLAFDTGVIYLAAKMRTASNPAIRKMWFVVPVGLAAGHVLAARHNYGLRGFCAVSPACGVGPQ